MIKRNKQRRMEREKEERRLIEEKHALEDDQLRRVLVTMFGCQGCDTVMSPPAPIYQCKDGHIICGDCKLSEKFKVLLSIIISLILLPISQECPTCGGDIIEGRNVAMERIANNVFISVPPGPSAPQDDDQTSEESSTLVNEE